MLIIGGSQTSGSTIAEATNILLRNSRRQTSTLARLNRVFRWGFLRALWLEEVVVRIAIPHGVAGIPSQRER